MAKINFGPAFSDFETLKNALLFLHNYFSSHKFIFFSLQLGINISDQTELLEYIINKNFKVNNNFKPENLWSSICIDITRPEAEILKSFSNGHRRRIKDSLKKNNLKTKIENNEGYLHLFIKLFVKMSKFKELPYTEKYITHLFNNINSFIYNNNKGFIVYIFDGENLVGGLIIVHQGNTARVFKGATDPERRDIPISHIGLFEAIKQCKANGYLTLDLWGYNHFANKNDQVYSINEFKKGFSGYFTFFPKRINFILRPFNYKVYSFLKFCKKTISRTIPK
ncbi:MAG: GNAT family N-acetyltransferase [Ginsengibacter sp.]